MYPCAVGSFYDALCSENEAIGLLVLECFESSSDLLGGIFLCGLLAPAGEHVVSVVVMMVMVVVMAAAGAVRTVVVMMLVLVIIVVVIVVVMVVLMLVVIIVMVVVVMMVLMLVVIVVVVMVMMVVLMLIVIVVVIMVMVMMLVLLLEKLLELVVEGILLGHCINQLCAGELIPLGCYDRRGRIELSQSCDHVCEPFLRETRGMAEDKAACIGNLVIEELAEVLLIHPALLGIYNGSEAVQLDVVGVDILHSLDNVAELADAGGLDEYPVRLILLQHLDQRLAEVTNKAAADAAGIHLGDLDSCVLQKSSVDTYLTELVLDKHQLLVLISVGDKLLDKGRLSGSKEARKNCYLCHVKTLLSIDFRLHRAFFLPISTRINYTTLL